ncbi:MAG: hypothetical protein QXK37_06260 [Candidatus Woesearchaeota archaeon]
MVVSRYIILAIFLILLFGVGVMLEGCTGDPNSGGCGNSCNNCSCGNSDTDNKENLNGDQNRR